jgi:hypothetical protein
MDPVTLDVIKSAGLSEEDTAKVIAALEAVTTTPGVGTVLRNPATGDVATYVREYGETYWRVRATNDRTWIETQPIVGWDTLYDAPATVTTPGEAAVDPVEAPVADAVADEPAPEPKEVKA